MTSIITARMRLAAAQQAKAREQRRYHLAPLIQSAKVCRDIASGSHDTTTARQCNVVAMMSAYNMGEAKEFFAAYAWQLHSQLVADQHGSASNKRKREVYRKFLNLSHSLPRLDVTIERRVTVTKNLSYSPIYSKVIGYFNGEEVLRSIRANPQPTVYVRINGRRVIAMLDTGDPESLTMDAATAHRLGLAPIRLAGSPVTGLAMRNIGERQVDHPGLFMANRMALGGLRIRNIMVIIVPDGYSFSHVTLGLPLLSRWRQVTFADSTVAFNSGRTPCVAPLQMTFESSHRESGRLVFRANASGKDLAGFIDTGLDSFMLSMRRLARPERKLPAPAASTGRLPSVVDALSTNNQQLKLSLGQHGKYILESKHVRSLLGLPRHGPDFSIGAAVLSAVKVRLDFAATTLCFLPQGLK